MYVWYGVDVGTVPRKFTATTTDRACRDNLHASQFFYAERVKLRKVSAIRLPKHTLMWTLDMGALLLN